MITCKPSHALLFFIATNCSPVIEASYVQALRDSAIKTKNSFVTKAKNIYSHPNFSIILTGLYKLSIMKSFAIGYLHTMEENFMGTTPRFSLTGLTKTFFVGTCLAVLMELPIIYRILFNSPTPPHLVVIQTTSSNDQARTNRLKNNEGL